MAITLQRTAASSSAGFSGSTHTLSVQVDSASNRGLLVAIGVGQPSSGTPSVSSLTYGGVSMTAAGTMSSTFGLLALYYLVAPAVGTADVSATISLNSGIRLTAWVLDGVHQTTAPTYLNGTNGTTIQWSWTGRTVGDFIACAVKRGGTVTWTEGGGLTERSDATVPRSLGGGSNTDQIAVGDLTADATTETPTFTLSGGEASSNFYGSVAWSEAAVASPTPAFGRYGVRGPIR